MRSKKTKFLNLLFSSAAELDEGGEEEAGRRGKLHFSNNNNFHLNNIISREKRADT